MPEHWASLASFLKEMMSALQFSNRLSSVIFSQLRLRSIPLIEQNYFSRISSMLKFFSFNIFSKTPRMDQVGLGKLKQPEIGFFMNRSKIVSLISFMLSTYETLEANFVKHSLA